MRSPPTFAALPVLLALIAGAARADDADDPAVVPYRPSVSTPAQLSAPGWLELEAGGLRARGPAVDESRTTLPCTLKLALTPDWGVRVSADAAVREEERTGVTSHGGDTAVVLKRRFAVDDATAWGSRWAKSFPPPARRSAADMPTPRSTASSAPTSPTRGTPTST